MGELSGRASLLAFSSGSHSNEELIPPDVIACRGWPPAGKGLVHRFQVGDLVGFHQEPVGKGTTAEASGLITQQLDRSVEDSVIVRFDDALFAVIGKLKHARLFDRRPDLRNRLQ